MSESSYHDRARIKRSIQASLIPPEWRLESVPSVGAVPDAVTYIRNTSNKLLSPRELAITETSDVNILLRKLASRQLSSLEVTKAFAKRAALLHQLTTCCTEIFFEDAFARAKQLDDHLQKTGETVGPLHGLPVSIKDLFGVEGVDTCIGWVGLTNKPASQDGNAATTLRRLGAVLYVKTNVPQSMMMSDSYNHVFGQCVSPLNRNFISGGSSGGEGALVAGKGSILGIGTDIGGSIRIPANICGLYGLSPSSGRQPYERNGPRQDIIRSVAGPMTRSLATIEKYMEALPTARPWEIDPQTIPIPWRTELCTTTKRLKIGFVFDDGVVKVQPPVARAVREVFDSLKAAGHEVFEWDASSHSYAYDLWERAILADGGEGCRKLCELSGEPLIEGMLVGKPENLLTTAQTHQLISDKYIYESDYLRRWFASNMDALIMPITPWVSYRPRTWVKSHQYVGYTSIWNLLDYPSLAIPVTKADRLKDSLLSQDWRNHQPRNKSDEFNHTQFDINLVHGMPVGVQIVTPKLQEEKCIAVAKVIEQSLSLASDVAVKL
ncbi:putative acetamidase [Talaromyces proteolyticus]|uniref:amidase n=1 Tax=Talaromyces proteolyticus TaxID=1131652 RepID=A0AAD4KMV6_9EURO|nr:putative acetamidase [Talaromyces proteolyticus]KAH8695242.1 putative acetamidase [Talaromyces proteolyticus]